MTASPKSKETVNPYPMIAPRFWHGMTSSVWWSMLSRNRFRISPSKLHMAVIICFVTPIIDVLAFIQHLIHGRRIRQTKLAGPPIFVLGHWRSGTTLMHELLHLDEQFTSPSTYQCFAPRHFLLTEPWMIRFGNFLLPEKRPMDNMKVGWQLPQEDEFALLILGAPTPYFRVAFPNNPVPHMDSLGSKTFDPTKLDHWKRSVDWFFRALSYHTPKPLIIKSPPHTGRLGVLAEMYPDAKFIHMIRDPRKLYPSTMKLWRVLDEVQSLQAKTDPELLHRFVIESLHRMYDSFEIDRQKISPDRVIDVHYEDLVAQPIETMKQIYSQFQIGDFAPIAKKIEERQTTEKDYKTNQLGLDVETEKMVLREWHDYAKKYGYLDSK